MYYIFNEIYEEELINILWKIGLKDIDIIHKIININKRKKINKSKILLEKSKQFYIKLDSIGEYNTSGYYNNDIEQLKIEWKFNRLWYNLHKELFIWHKFFYYENNKNNKKKKIYPK